MPTLTDDKRIYRPVTDDDERRVAALAANGLSDATVGAFLGEDEDRVRYIRGVCGIRAGSRVGGYRRDPIAAAIAQLLTAEDREVVRQQVIELIDRTGNVVPLPAGRLRIVVGEDLQGQAA